MTTCLVAVTPTPPQVEEHEAKLNLCQKEHEQSRDKLQQSTLQAKIEKLKSGCVSKPISINVSGVNTHLPAILMFTRAIRF